MMKQSMGWSGELSSERHGYPVVERIDDATMIIRFGEETDPSANDLVHAFVTELAVEPLEGQRHIVPGFASVAVVFDPIVANDAGAREAADRLRVELITAALNHRRHS